jgi:hypothetical protein
MELHAVDVALGIFESVDTFVSLRGHVKSFGQAGDAIAVTQPDVHLLGQTGKQACRFINHFQPAVAVTALAGGAHFPAQLLGHQLQAIADSQHGSI